MNYIKITKNDIANGEGVRVVLWLSGCSHNCKGCHNPQTHNPQAGVLFDSDAKSEIFEELSKSYVSGITLSGGDPLYESSLIDVLDLINEIRDKFPNKTIWIYSGYTYEHCHKNPLRKEIVENCDVFVDGRYDENLKDITLKWRGSSNQRVINIKDIIK